MRDKKREPDAEDPAKVVGPPTQSQGIREAQANTNPSDPTKKVHPDSVPLPGATQPSRFDSVMPSAEPVQPDIDRRPAGKSGESRTMTRNSER